MVIIRNGKKYYTLEESKKITKDFINKSADELIKELKKRKSSLQKTNSISSKNGKLCIK